LEHGPRAGSKETALEVDDEGLGAYNYSFRRFMGADGWWKNKTRILNRFGASTIHVSLEHRITMRRIASTLLIVWAWKG
jgi:hypothetical protein